MKRLFIFFIMIFLYSYIFAQEDAGHLNKKLDNIKAKTEDLLDSNESDEFKLETITNYLYNLEFDDNFTKKDIKNNLLAHHKNFIMFIGYDSKNHNDIDSAGNTYPRDHREAQFQLSLKHPLYKDFLRTGAILYGAYTQNSYWQVYDTEHSSPFRETNYMPELFLEWNMNKDNANEVALKRVRASIIHQSNGKDIPRSRSWNRSELMVEFGYEDFYFGGYIWDRWNESPKSDENDTNGDDNPDLQSYIGNGRVFLKYKGGSVSACIYHQNRIDKYDRHKGSTRIDMSFPSFNRNFHFIIRYYNGYGESLIDYNHKVNKISFGILLSQEK